METFNAVFDYAESDLIALNAVEDDYILYNDRLAENEDEMKKISSANKQSSDSGNATGINFSDYQTRIPIIIESTSSDISNPY